MDITAQACLIDSKEGILECSSVEGNIRETNSQLNDFNSLPDLSRIKNHLSSSLSEINLLLSSLKKKDGATLPEKRNDKEQRSISQEGMSRVTISVNSADKRCYSKIGTSLSDGNNALEENSPSCKSSSVTNEQANPLQSNQVSMFFMNSCQALDNAKRKDSKGNGSKEVVKEFNFERGVTRLFHDKICQRVELNENSSSNSADEVPPIMRRLRESPFLPPTIKALLRKNRLGEDPRRIEITETVNRMSDIIPTGVIEKLKQVSCVLPLEKAKSLIKFISLLPPEVRSNLDKPPHSGDLSNLLSLYSSTFPSQTAPINSSPSPYSQTRPNSSPTPRSPSTSESPRSNSVSLMNGNNTEDSKNESSSSDEDFENCNGSLSPPKPSPENEGLMESIFSSLKNMFKVSMALPPGATVSSVTELLVKAKVENVIDVVVHCKSHSSRAYVTFGDVENQQKAIKLDGKLEVEGYKVSVRLHKDKFWNETEDQSVEKKRKKPEKKKQTKKKFLYKMHQ